MAQRVQITVEVNVPSGQTPRDTIEWISKVFDYQHRSLDAKVDVKSAVVTGEAPPTLTPTPTIDELI